MAILACLFTPLALFALFYRNRKKLGSKTLQARYGSFLEGTKSESGKYYLVAFMWPVSFFARRLLLSLSLVYYQGFFWGQMAI